MRFISLELKGFKRMMLNNVETFIIRPQEPIQLILGTNGSGKSSLIGELTPLPPNPNDYRKDGSKTITIAHQGHTYVLKSWFQPSQKHSFLKDGEELNPGGTVTVQKELCWQQFGITPEIHGLLIGLEFFTHMSPSRRREWFTMLSDVSYDYALAVFGSLKERARDLSGAVKLAKKRLVAESDKLISAEEEQQLQQDVQQLLDEIELLNSQRAPVEKPSASYRQTLNDGMTELNNLSLRLLRIRFANPYSYNPYAPTERDDWGELKRPLFTSLADVDQFITGLKFAIGNKETLINKAVADLDKIKAEVDVLLKAGEEGINALLEKQNDLRARRTAILAQRKLGLEFSNPGQCLAAFDANHESLVAIFSVLPENPDRQFSQTRLQELQTELLQLKNTRLKKEQELARLHSQREHLESHKANGKTVCPKCHHTWINGFDDVRYDQLLDRIVKIEEECKTLENRIEAQELQIASTEEYALHYRDYVRLTRSCPILNPFWDYLAEHNYVTHSPRVVLPTLETLRKDLSLAQDALAVEQELGELTQLVMAAQQLEDTNLADSNAKLEDLDNAIGNLTAELSKLQKDLTDYSHYRKQLAEALDLGGRIEALQSSLEKTNTEMVEMLRRETLNHCIRQLQHSLALKTETLNSAKLQRGIIDDLEQQIAQLIVQEDATKALAKELSPMDGLIAEGLLGFIRTYTGQMNSIIKKIWSYPLYIKDCGVSGEVGAELDYKFPLVVQSKSNEVADVKLGSTGMQEIVNLAFKMVAMKYLGLAESPLYLDEFGKTFDEAHRATATEVIKNLMLQQPFTQLYMVSHYESSYGALTNAEICVICPNNITIPTQAKYNQHVTIQ